jgi:sulfite dehydrogenase
MSRLLLWAVLAAAAGTGVAGQDVKMPPERAVYRKSELPGYQLVMANCLMCHSAEYVLTQPPTSSRAYWDATVKKMKKPFGAPFPDEDIAAIVDYLTKTYGAERPAAGQTPAAVQVRGR